MAGSSHHERITRAFTQQAERFDEVGSTLTSEAYLEWALQLLALPPGALVLDVATGTGLLARAIQAQGHRVVGIDATPAMLAGATHPLDLIAVARAEELPLASGTFDAVTCRFGLHHVLDPLAVLREMIRVCRARGTFGVVELVAPAQAELARRYNRYERLRDPSHVLAQNLDGLRALLRTAGLDLQRIEHRDVAVDLRRWLRLAGTCEADAQSIRLALVQELEGGLPTGLRPRRNNRDLSFTQTWAILVARTQP